MNGTTSFNGQHDSGSESTRFMQQTFNAIQAQQYQYNDDMYRVCGSDHKVMGSNPVWWCAQLAMVACA